MPYEQIDGDAACCWLRQGRWPREATAAFGALVQISKPNVSLAHQCEPLCDANPRCTFFSHAALSHSCVLCAECDLHRSSYALLFMSRGVLRGRITSWARVEGTKQVARAARTPLIGYSPRAEPVPWVELESMLQGNYSVHLYGGVGRVNVSAFRVLWLSALPASALRWVSALGVCKYEPRIGTMSCWMACMRSRHILPDR